MVVCIKYLKINVLYALPLTMQVRTLMVLLALYIKGRWRWGLGYSQIFFFFFLSQYSRAGSKPMAR